MPEFQDAESIVAHSCGMGCAVFAVGFVVEIVLVAMKLMGMLPAWSWVAVTMPVVAPLLLIVAATAIITLID